MALTPFTQRLLDASRTTFRDAARVSFDLFKVMVPVLITVKILKEFDLVQYLAVPLAPFMTMMGLPAELGLAWATAIALNIYSGLAVYVSLLPDLAPLTVGQATIMATITLFAHNMILELKVAERCGVNLWVQAAIRMAAALCCGVLMHMLFAGWESFQAPATLLFKAPSGNPSLGAWAWSETVNLFWIFVIILTLMGLMRVLQFLRVVAALNAVLAPVLWLMGIGRAAATITVVGVMLGLNYGGGLIIHEAKSGRVGQRDLFASLSLMGMAHALIEDTLLMTLIGANFLGTFWIRLAFAMLATALVVKIYDMVLRRRKAAL